MSTETTQKTYTIPGKVQEERTVEVEFPFYRRHDLSFDDSGSSVTYTRVDGDGTQISITVRDRWARRSGTPDEIEVEIEHGFSVDMRCPDYCLGLGDYAGTEEEFNEAWGKAKRWLTRLG